MFSAMPSRISSMSCYVKHETFFDSHYFDINELRFHAQLN